LHQQLQEWEKFKPSEDCKKALRVEMTKRNLKKMECIEELISQLEGEEEELKNEIEALKSSVEDLEREQDEIIINEDSNSSDDNGAVYELFSNAELRGNIVDTKEKKGKYQKKVENAVEKEKKISLHLQDKNQQLDTAKAKMAEYTNLMLAANYTCAHNRILEWIAKTFIESIFKGHAQYSIPVVQAGSLFSERIIDIYCVDTKIAHEVKSGKWQKDYEKQLEKDMQLLQNQNVKEVHWHFVAINGEKVKNSDFNQLRNDSRFKGTGIAFWSWCYPERKGESMFIL